MNQKCRIIGCDNGSFPYPVCQECVQAEQVRCPQCGAEVPAQHACDGCGKCGVCCDQACDEPVEVTSD